MREAKPSETDCRAENALRIGTNSPRHENKNGLIMRLAF